MNHTSTGHLTAASLWRIVKTVGTASLLWSAGSAASTEVNKCVDANGRIEYRATRCDGQAQGQPLPGGAAAAKKPTAASADGARSAARRVIYGFSGGALVAMDPDTGKLTPIPLPANFPSYSRPISLAHDTDLNIVTFVTRDGEGYLYRYDAGRRQWLDYRSMNHFEVISLMYDAGGKRYVARANDGAVLYISNQGEFQGGVRQNAAPGPVAGAAPGAWRAPPKPAIESPPPLPTQAVRDQLQPAGACVSSDPGLCATRRSAPQPQLADTPMVQLPVIVGPLPKGVAAGAEIIVVSGYSAFMPKVIVDRPGKPVLLVLASHESGRWQVAVSRDTTLRAILVSTAGRSTVDGPLGVPTYAAPTLCCATNTQSADFRSVMTALGRELGVERIHAFRGQYDLPSVVTISELDPPSPDLTLAGTPVSAPDKTFEFELTTTDLRSVRWTNVGPKSPADAAVSVIDGKALVLPSGAYHVRPHEGLYVVSKPGDAPRLLPLPQGFPAFSWATDLAYDGKRGIVSVVSLGGEGFFYRYDVSRGAWLDFRSMNNFDVTALSYDSASQRYVGWIDYGIVLNLSAEGAVLGRREVRGRLPGLLETIGNLRGTQARRLTIVPKDGYLAFVLVEGSRAMTGLQGNGGLVTRVWTYDPQRDIGWLSYKR